MNLDEVDDPEEYLHRLDRNIPPHCLYRFYGGINNNEFY